ncbi:reverse transcriptase domain-containing protein [Tanacetum coccineum]
MTLELADRSISRPIDIAKDVNVKVGVFQFLADFVVVDFEPDPRVSLIIGRCFLKTGRALIDMHEGELTLRVDNEAITYNLDQTLRYSVNYNDMTANRIDVVELACEEYSQEVLGFFDMIASGNPTPGYDPILNCLSWLLSSWYWRGLTPGCYDWSWLLMLLRVAFMFLLACSFITPDSLIHVSPGSVTLVSPGYVMIPSGRFPTTVQGQHSIDFVTDGVSLNAMKNGEQHFATDSVTEICVTVCSSYSAFDHDHDILVESRSWILQLAAGFLPEPKFVDSSRFVQTGANSRTAVYCPIDIAMLLLTRLVHWITHVGSRVAFMFLLACSFITPDSLIHVSPGSVTLVSPGYVMIPSGFCQETTHFQQDEFDVTCDHSMEPTGFEIDMHFLRGSRSLLLPT